MVDGIKPLKDADLRDFIRNGYLPVMADFSEPLHAQIRERMEAVYEKERNPGNNLLPRVPEIQRVYDHPAVKGALTRILGPGYLMHPHRHGHLNPPGSKGQSWHKDSYVRDAVIRRPRPRFVLALYYPQDVTLDMGPTGLIPGRQYYPSLSDADPTRTTESAMGLCAPAGTVTIVHNDAWHCAMPNTSANKRFMLKFLFERCEEPTAGAGDAPEWEGDPTDVFNAVHADVWRWLHGQPSPSARPWDAAEADTLRARLDDTDVTVSLPAAYALAQFGAAAVPLLVETLAAQARAVSENFIAKSPGNPHGINPPALPAANALASIGEPSVAPLVELLTDANWCVRTLAADTLGNIGPAARAASVALATVLSDDNPRVRRHAAEALGRIGSTDSRAVGALVERIRDPETAVRHNVALSLAKIAPTTNVAIPGLAATLHDDDRYVRHIAAQALRRIGTPEAHAVLFDALFTARWCDKTSPDSMY